MKTCLYTVFICLAFAFFGCGNDVADDTMPAAAPTPLSTDASSYVPADYQLVWNDEFDNGPLPDTTRWGYQVGNHGWTAREVQMYKKAAPANVGVENGMLRITATFEEGTKIPVSSTRLVSKGKADFEQGYFEFRAKFPQGEGLRSAIWMVGDTVSKIGWPKAGEIDIVEHYGKMPTVVGAAVQTPANFWNGKGQLGGAKIVKTATDDFHVYSCEWTDELLTFSVDGEPFWTYQPLPGEGLNGWPFEWPYYLIFNLSVGGERGPKGAKLDKSIFPANLLIDYVRVYQK